jgi:hypothetical protein
MFGLVPDKTLPEFDNQFAHPNICRKKTMIASGLRILPKFSNQCLVNLVKTENSHKANSYVPPTNCTIKALPISNLYHMSLFDIS